MTITETDGAPCVPTDVNSLCMGAGERYGVKISVPKACPIGGKF